MFSFVFPKAYLVSPHRSRLDVEVFTVFFLRAPALIYTSAQKVYLVKKYCLSQEMMIRQYENSLGITSFASR